MRKLLCMIALTFMGCLNSMAAATTYGVFVAGVQVTSDNADDISRSSPEISGKVYYDASIKTLYLEKASINVRSSYTIKHGIQCKENVTIKVVGSASIVTNSSNCTPIQIEEGRAVTIAGTTPLTELTLKNDYGTALEVGLRSKCIISSIQMTATGNYGIKGINGNSEVVALRNTAFVKAKGREGSISQLYELEALISTPMGAYFSDDNHCVVDVASFPTATTSEVALIAPTSYDIFVGGVEINSYNKSNVTGNTIQGKVEFDPDSRVLTLTNATINHSATSPIIQISTNDNVIIRLKGTNKLLGPSSSPSGYGIFSNAELTIAKTSSTSGTLDISGVQVGIWMNGKNRYLRIGQRNESNKSAYAPKVTINSKGVSISTSSSNDNRMYVYCSTLIASATNATSSPITGFEELNCDDDCDITSPDGAYYDTAKRQVVDYRGDYSTVKSVTIQPVKKYGLMVGQGFVNSINRTDIKAGVTKGTVSFDGYNTLTLDNATINGGIAVLESLGLLYIELKGTNTITSDLWGVLASNSDLTIRSVNGVHGVLNITSNSPAITMYNSESQAHYLSITNCGVYTSGNSAITGSTNVGATYLTIDNAYVRINNSSAIESAIYDFSGLTLDGCFYKTPYSAYYDYTTKMLRNLNNNVVLKGCYIEPGTSYGVAIDGNILTSKNINNIPTLCGFSTGTASFNKGTKTLRLDNVTLHGTGAIETYEDVTIESVGDNDFYCNDNGLQIRRGTTTITGSGSLSFYSSGTGCFMNENTTLDIKSTSASFISDTDGSGLEGTDMNSTVNITNSNVLFRGSNYNATVHNLNAFNLYGCEINNDGHTTATYQSFSSSAGGIVTGVKKNLTTSDVRIRPIRVLGDINSDGVVNTTDITALYNVIFGTDTTIDKGICDLDGNGKVNTTDVTELYNIIFGTAK